MRRMSSDLTSPQPVGDPTPGAEATLIPPANRPSVEPEPSGAGPAPTGQAGGDGSLDVVTPRDTAHPPSDVPGLANQFAAAARALASEVSVAAALQRLVDIARVIVPGCHHAGVTVLRRGRPRTSAATDDVYAAIDLIQYETGEGPCLSAIVEQPAYRTGDLAAETRWPGFAGPAVERTGVRSVLAYRLSSEGALTLYSRERDAFDDEAEAIGTILAAHAALALARAREREQISGLEQAVASNRSIGMAIGILMAIYRVGQDEAFDLLRTVSQRTNRKLREIADEVVHTGQLPGATPH
jgi:hypothetical protein